jgi:hypothetical protein
MLGFKPSSAMTSSGGSKRELVFTGTEEGWIRLAMFWRGSMDSWKDEESPKE